MDSSRNKDDIGKRLLNPADDASLMTYSFVRRFYNQSKQIMVSYYWDQYENRWIRAINPLPEDTFSGFGYTGSVGNPLVFPWVYGGRPSVIAI
jgi:hypothetical protein